MSKPIKPTLPLGTTPLVNSRHTLDASGKLFNQARINRFLAGVLGSIPFIWMQDLTRIVRLGFFEDELQGKNCRRTRLRRVSKKGNRCM